MNNQNYQIRYSKKAKYLQLRISPQQGLEVIIPTAKKFSREIIEKFISEKELWIKRNWLRLQQIEEQKQNLTHLPQTIALKAIQEFWEVSYIATANQKIELIANSNKQITLVGNIANKEKCLKKLRTWVKETAEHSLSQQIHHISHEIALPFQSINIRNNMTRWGSCSHQKNINLCCNLLFLPTHLMRHVIIHELCHTKIMNHGIRFWKLMEKFDERAHEHTKELRDAVKEIPYWMSVRNIPEAFQF